MNCFHVEPVSCFDVGLEGDVVRECLVIRNGYFSFRWSQILEQALRTVQHAR